MTKQKNRKKIRKKLKNKRKKLKNNKNSRTNKRSNLKECYKTQVHQTSRYLTMQGQFTATKTEP